MGARGARAPRRPRRAGELRNVFRPDVVLLDIGMPGMDGYEVARRMRQQPRSPAARVLVALTGWGQDEDRRRPRNGFDHHLAKPVDIGALQALLANL